MKQTVEKRKPSGFVDYVALTLTTWGVGYGPVAPGTWGSAVGVGIYLGVAWFETAMPTAGSGAGFASFGAFAFRSLAVHHTFVVNSVLLLAFCLAGIWASSRSIPLLGSSDPSEAVVDEVMGQLITFCFVPFGIGWPFILAGFLLFRLFDIWKPYPIDALQVLPGGIGVCADDIVAGVYAGVCLAIGYAVFLSI